MSANLFDAEDYTKSERILYTPSAFAKKSLAYMQEIGRLKSLKSHSSIRENLESYLLFLILDGEGSLNYLGNHYELKAGDLVFIDCRNHYEHTSSEEHPWELMWVHFNGVLPQGYYPIFMEKNEQKPVVHPKNGLDEYEKILTDLMEKKKSKNILEEMEASVTLSNLLLECLKEVVSDEALLSDNEEALKKEDYESVREYINEHFLDAGLRSALKIQYGVTVEELGEVFEKRYGISIDAYISNRKFNKAKELLRFTIKPIPEIVAESGMGTEEMFRELFIECEEMTPEEYRRKWAQWIKG